MDNAFQIRPAAATDIATVAALFREYADALDVDLGYQNFAAELAALPGAYDKPNGALLVAVSADGALVGCVGVRPLRDHPGSCEMKRLHTRRAVRGAGIGRALAIAAIEAAVRAGYNCMRLDTLPSMLAAQALYRSLGFAVTDAYYDTAIAGTIFMRKQLISQRPAGH